MLETVKVVKGYEIYRLKGTKGSYWVTVKRNETMPIEKAWFRTIKAAAEYIENNL